MGIWRMFTRSKGKQLAPTPNIDLHLVPGTHHKIRSLTFDVKSRETARIFLIFKDLTGALLGNQLTIATNVIRGLKFVVAKAKSSHAELTN